MKRKSFTTNIDPELIKKIKIQAIHENCSVADILEKILIDYLKEKDKPSK